MSKQFQVVCPECKGINTLVMIHTKKTTYTIEAMPSPTHPDRGTYTTVQNGNSQKDRYATCTNLPCKFTVPGWCPSPAIVREVTT